MTGEVGRSMRIAFLVTCLEPGRDGVGDYTRDLASACVRLGHGSCLVALNDRYVDAPLEQRQRVRGAEIEVIRLPASSGWPERMRLVRGWLERRSPDWISLQFVPYGFNRKGVVIGLGERLVSVTAGRRLQMMFHEVWTGEGGPLRARLVGAVQRLAVRRLVDRLRPEVVHTSNSRYLSLLAANDIHGSVLPLSGTIPFSAAPGAHWLERALVEAGMPAELAGARQRCWRFGFFGSLHPVWSPEPLFTHLAEAAHRTGRRVVIASIGRLGPGESLWGRIAARYGDAFSFAALGERSTNEVSAFLQNIDFGIAATPWKLIGKSGTVAAMLDHGVPVIVSRDDEQICGHQVRSAAEPLLYRMDHELPEWLLSVQRLPPRDRLPDVAQRFVADLTRRDAD